MNEKELVIRDFNDISKIEINPPLTNFMGENYKTPIEKRLKGSKFKILLNTMTDNEVKALYVVLFHYDKTKLAINYWNKAVDSSIQKYALLTEIQKRIANKEAEKCNSTFSDTNDEI